MFNGQCQEDKNFYIRLESLIRESNIYKYLNKKFETELDFIRSKAISNLYDPYKDYKNLSSAGSTLMIKILEKFVSSIKK